MNIRLAISTLVAAGLAAQDPRPAPAPPPTPAPAPAPTGEKPAPPAVLELGDELPADITLHDLDGRLHTFGDLRGKVVVLHIWSSTCPWEIVAEPKINGLADSYRDRGVVVLGLAANVNEIGKKPEPAAFEAKAAEDRPYPGLRRKAAESEVNHPILVDHGARVARLLDGRTTPQMFVFDSKGRLVYTGALDNDGRGSKPESAANYVRAALDATLAGEAVGLPRTKPYG
ncbi:MAG: redoxin family protein [Planctomycetes bacterium]|nr:redoxin family protein [Planctomycetota bacterium]